ncbi:hypothetical protein NDU88_006165 [Pleurodeles waltl]|uniref:Acyl-CoA dehydrogenase 6 n=1 Tax=Pleurodeles waltl TaxID=8319 RepID=A0AAV7MC47_PLEWA|nr:hypothetical protein NDU88_006165 [Pleurodeles waltl]
MILRGRSLKGKATWRIAGSKIKGTASYKYLGITLDNNGSFRLHKDEIKKKGITLATGLQFPSDKLNKYSLSPLLEIASAKVFLTLAYDSVALQGRDSKEEYGGMGLDFTYSTAVAEELGNIRCGGVPMAIGVQSDMATPALARFGSNELKRQFLAPTIAGDVVACLGVSEAGAGSDVSNIKTSAVKKGDDYVINGGKMWITNGCQADWMCLLTNTSDGLPHRNKSLICLPMNLPGIHIAKKIDKMGLRSSDTAQIFFDNVRVPCNYVIGEEGMGFTYQMLQFQEERMWGAASVLKSFENVIEETIEYTRQRKIYNQPVLHNQVVHFRLAELLTEVELLRSLLYRAVDLYVKGNDVTKLASMAKLKAGRLAREITDSCLQFWGGMGFTNEVLVSRLYSTRTSVTLTFPVTHIILVTVYVTVALEACACVSTEAFVDIPAVRKILQRKPLHSFQATAVARLSSLCDFRSWRPLRDTVIFRFNLFSYYGF